jgi:hypothetical protein
MLEIQVRLARQHQTQTRESTTMKRVRDAHPQLKLSAHVPVRQQVVVALASELDILRCSAEELLPSVLEALPSNEALEIVGVSDDWQPWRMEAARDTYTFTEPVAAKLLEGSHAAVSLAASLGSLPSLYGDGIFAPYRVFAQWFCTNGNGLEWHRGCLRDNEDEGGSKFEPLSEQSYADELAQFRKRFDGWPTNHEPCASSPVRLYPLSPSFSALFSVPEDVEDEYLKAAELLCRYILSRPVWQNFAYSPHELVSKEHVAQVLRDGTWRQIQLANGMKYRTLVEQAHTRLVLGPWRQRLQAMGFEDQSFFPCNYELPPRMRSFLPNPILGV